MTVPTNTDLACDVPLGLRAEHDWIVQLCQDASVEMTFHDTARLRDAGTLLPAGSRIFISHLPRQQWEQTVEAAVEVSQCGLKPVPHIPARQLSGARELDQLLVQLVRRAAVTQVLLIAGDRPQPAGPFSASSEVLRTGLLEQHGISRVSLAGHPEGHPQVGTDVLRASEEEKIRYAEERGFEAGFITQFTFDSSPIIEWVRGLRARGISNGVRLGLAGPARLSTLLKYAVHCGVGPSIRALSSRRASFGRLLGDRGPEALVCELARARSEGLDIEGIHLFSFGGLLRTCRWVQAVGQGRFTLDDAHGFIVGETG